VVHLLDGYVSHDQGAVCRTVRLERHAAWRLSRQDKEVLVAVQLSSFGEELVAAYARKHTR
jgi:hypothetical protein